MTSVQEASAFREALRGDLRAALKSRQSEVISTLRTMIAAIDNAEAVHPGVESPRRADGVIAHSSPGVGSTEASRRELGMADLQAIIGELIRECETSEAVYRSKRRCQEAERLRRRAEFFRAHLRGMTDGDHQTQVSDR